MGSEMCIRDRLEGERHRPVGVPHLDPGATDVPKGLEVLLVYQAIPLDHDAPVLSLIHI